MHILANERELIIERTRAGLDVARQLGRKGVRKPKSRLWIISEEMSISMLTKPSTYTPAGICCKVLFVGVVIAEPIRR